MMVAISQRDVCNFYVCMLGFLSPFAEFLLFFGKGAKSSLGIDITSARYDLKGSFDDLTD